MLIRADGAARGNPGPAAAGAVVIDLSRADAEDPDCPPVAVVARPLGTQTNNYAEYTAVILALEKALALGAREARLVLDSQLVVEQLAGRWKVRHPAIRPLVARVHELLARLDAWDVRHERRASNRAADALANLALDEPAAAAAAEAGEAPATAPASDLAPIGGANIGAACAIFDGRGRVLLVHHTYGLSNWEIPGGIALPGESPLATAKRELREETRLSVDEGRLTGVYFEPKHDLGPMLHFVFRFDLPVDAAPVPQPPEISEVGWFLLDDLPSPISDFTERRILDARADGAEFDVVEARTWH